MLSSSAPTRVIQTLIVLIATCFACGPLTAQSPPSPKLLALPPGDGPLKVGASFHLLAVHKIDDEAESFSFSGVLNLTWRDERQAFDPESEGVSEKVYNGEYQFNELSPSWYPQVVLANAVDLVDSQGVLLRVKPDGTSILTQTITAEARTRLELRCYPYDKQQLQATFAILGFNEDEVVLTAPHGATSSDFSKIQIPQWKLTDIQSSTGLGTTSVSGKNVHLAMLTITLDTERRSFFIMRLVILPLILIVVLSWSVFWMDRSSLGDRMSVSFVGILTAVAYQIMVSDIMPHISYITLVNAIISFSLLIMSATVFINLLVGSLDKKGEYERGERVDLRCRIVFPAIYTGLIALAFLACFTLF